MTVSVIIPTYNRASYVTKAIESVLAQTYNDFEIIVIDDGSTDNTKEVLSPFMDKITYIWKPNGGCASARNVGIQTSKGEFIAFLDSDDLFEPTKFEIQVKTLMKTRADFVYSKTIEFNEKGEEWLGDVAASNNPEKFAVEHFLTNCARPGAIFYRRGCVLRIGGFDESLLYNEDTAFLQKVAIECRAAYSDYPSARVRNHPGAKSRNRIEIYKALLESSESILKQYPEFAFQIGPLAQQRIAEIRGKLAEELFRKKRIDELSKLLLQNKVYMSIPLFIGIHTKSIRLYKIARKALVISNQLRWSFSNFLRLKKRRDS
jgi:glycosyltransferase involved in cell wall biosynthesis